LSIGNINIHAPTGDPLEHARLFRREIERHERERNDADHPLQPRET
jgi:hypothetical protein